MRIATLFVACMFSLIGGAFALSVGDKEMVVTVSDTYVSRYIWRGLDVFADNDPAHQPSVDVTFPKLVHDINVSMNVWASFPGSDGHEDLEEFDYTISVNRDFLGLFNVAAGWTYYSYPNTKGTSNINEPWLGFTWLKLPFIPFDTALKTWIGSNFETQHGGLNSGIYYSYGTDTKIPLPLTPITQEGQTLGLSAINWGQDGVADMHPSRLYATDLGLYTGYAFGKLTVTPTVHYVINHRELINNGNDELYGGVTASWSF